MKIIFINRFFFPDHSATSQILSDLAFFLAESGEEVHVITSRLRYDNPAALLPSHERTNAVEAHRVWSSRFGRLLLPLRLLDYLTFTLSAVWKLRQLAESGDTVIIKTDPPMLSVPAGWALKGRNIHLINWLQDLFPEVAAALGLPGFHGCCARFLQGLRNRSLQAAARNIVIGERMRTQLVQEGISEQHITIIHNWADEKALVPIETAAVPLRREWGVADRFVLAYSGNFGRAHEYETIIGAARLLADSPDILFLFIGGGARIEDLRAEGKKLGLTNLLFKPYQPRQLLGSSLAVADVHLVSLRPELEGLIVPSKYYGIAAVGRPTLFIGDEQGEIGRILAESGSGFSILQGDSEVLAKTIRKLRDAKKLREGMGRNARRDFERRFSMQTGCQRWLQIIRAVRAED